MNRTQNALLNKPSTCERHWDVPLNENVDYLDGISAIGRLLVTPSELPSASRNIRVTQGRYVKADGSVAVFAGVGSFGLPPSSTQAVWLSEAGTLSCSGDFPVSMHLPLATVVTGPEAVLSIVDERVVLRMCAWTQNGGAVNNAEGAVVESPAPSSASAVGSAPELEARVAALTRKVDVLVSALERRGHL